MSITIEPPIHLFKTKPFAHQIADVKLLLQNSVFGLLSEMGTGKTKIVIDAACTLQHEGVINTVVVICPASVRGVWLCPELGEIKKHAWTPARVIEFHGRGARTIWLSKDAQYANSIEWLDWLVTNYEFIRSEGHRDRLAKILSRGGVKAMLVLDESSFIKSRTAKQAKACAALAPLAARRVILTGTPITNNPLDLWSQLRFLDPGILPYKNFWQFRAEYAVMGGWQHKQVVKFKNLERLQALVAPHVVRREKKDCLDLPAKIYTTLEAPLEPKNWKIYCQMRDEAVVWLDENPSLAAQAGVRVMRLAQILTGFLGGFVEDVDDPIDQAALHGHGVARKVWALGDEKLRAFKEWLQLRLEEDPGAKVIAWCRFRAQIERVSRELACFVPTFKLYGGQSREDRETGIARFSALADPRPALLVAQPQAGGFGLNLVASSLVAYLSNDFNLATRLQSEDRVHRPGQVKNVIYLDVLATGPEGQRTVDHAILKALWRKDDLARWTAGAWKQALLEER